MTICVPLFLEFMPQVTAVKGIIWKADRNRIIGLWANANHQGETAGINMAGGDAVYKRKYPSQYHPTL